MVTWIMRLAGIVLGVTLLFAARNAAIENRQFRIHGERAVVNPFSRYTETTTTRKKFGIQMSESKSKSADLIFTTRDGRTVTAPKNLPDDVFDRFAAHQVVTIEYLPDSPTTTRFAGESSRPITLAMLGILAFAATYIFWNRL